jgi:hypothetical protein
MKRGFRSPTTWLVFIGAAAVLVIVFSPQDKTINPRPIETTVQGISSNSEIIRARTGDRPYRLR